MAKSRKKAPVRRTQKAGSRYQVFVSHATADKWLATVLCEKIERTGASTSRDDRDIDGGDDIPDRIRGEIKRSNEMVILLTPESTGRPWVLLEAGGAWVTRARYRIVAVLCHVRVDTIPEMLASKKAIPLNAFDEYLKELKERVRRHKR